MRKGTLLVWLVSALLTGCGSSGVAEVSDPDAVAETPPPGSEITDDERATLLAQADRLAEEHLGRAVRVEAVRTRSSTARAITGWSPEGADAEVWVLAVSGDDYFCRYCSGPSDEGKRSRHLTLTLEAGRPTDERLTFGMSLTPYDLSSYGHVQTLRG